ncbi:MAG: hypothetical protein HYU63_08240, partial [Armatimonadetes bacterium]|nr:hypothetical protein [Armatimonadota bacterium]
KSSIVITSRGAHPSSRMLNRAIICGLISVGVNVYDLRVIPSPISSYTIRNSEAKGGIHTAISPLDSKISLVQFFNKVGINIDKTMERKIENIFFREDFRRTIMDEIGTIDFPARAVERYIQGYFNNLDVEGIKKLNCKVIIDYAFGSSSLVLPLILGKLGCETVTINAYLDPFKEREAQEDKEKALKQLSNIVLTLGANLGVLIDADAQSLILVDEKGWIIKDSELLALLSKLFLSNSSHIKGNNMLAVTLTAPSIIDKFAKEYNYKIIRTKLDSRYLMQLSALTEKKLLFSGDIEGRFIFPSFQPVFDAMFTFAKILEFMARSRQKLSELRETLPSFKILIKKVECLWQQKGKIMRRLIELSKNNKIEMLDGIKINLKDDWIAIIPDQIEPCIHLYAESSNYEKANQIIEEYINKINNLKKGESLVEAKIKEKIRETFQTLPEELAFYFCSPSGYLGIKALSLEEFKEIIKSISLDSLDFHIQRGDFSRWLEYGLGEIQLAEKIKSADKFQGENLRKYLINIFKKYPKEMI